LPVVLAEQQLSFVSKLTVTTVPGKVTSQSAAASADSSTGGPAEL
jgi:hypothetical protein